MPLTTLPGGYLELLLAQIALLEQFFGAGWLADRTTDESEHPAVKRWAFCQKLAARGGVLRIPEDLRWLPEMAQLLLDSATLVECTRGNITSLNLGNLGNYGDERVQKRLKAVAVNPDQFLDAMTELTYAAWHISKGHRVVATEDPGIADFSVEVPGLDLPIIADCKRVKSKSALRRLRDAISTANRQIKAVNSAGIGLVIMDISGKVPNPEMFSDAVPLEVEQAAVEVSRSIKEFNSSVSGVILVWTDFLIRELFEPRHKLFVVLRRRSKVVSHAAPKVPLPPGIAEFLPGHSVVFEVHLELPR